MSREQASRDSPGGSSRGDERGTKAQRRTASSSGFLVDSFLPRSKNFRSSNHQPRLSESDHRSKHITSEIEPAPKKRSRFHWSRQRESRASDPVDQEVIIDKSLSETPHPPQNSTTSEPQGESSYAPSDATGREPQTESSHAPNDATGREPQVGPGLDRDSLQIVNLALNLSESRRRGQLGYATPNRVSGTWASSADGRASATGSNLSHGSYAGHNSGQSIGNDHVNYPRSSGASLATNAVLNSLPESAKAETVPQGISGGTLARAANARHHFELRHEYLRLLPSLPPLKPLESHSIPDSSRDYIVRHPQHRAFNPLQAIRNRKVRFRERCPIDTEADGWNDVDKVHSWIDAIEAAYSRQARGPLECLILPPFQQGAPETPAKKAPNTADASTVSPPSSVRHVSRTGSLKARRPRSDWIIYPEELLADAAWVEDTQNKSRIVDRDGNILYPNPASLVVNDSQQEQIQGKSSVSTGRPSSHTSKSDARRSMSIEINDPGRGRQRRRFKAPHRLGRSNSASEQESGSKRHRFKIRPSSSSDSSADEKLYHDPFTAYNKNSRRQSVSPLRRKGNIWSEKRGSLSSVPSVEDRYDPLSISKMEGRGSNVAPDSVYFPGIAANLSPPSSRASSPAKRGFPLPSGRAHSRSSHPRKCVDDDSSVDFEAEQMDSIPVTEPLSHLETEPTFLPVKASTFHAENLPKASNHERKDSSQHESKLRGIFKGPGKIAGKVGNEVSKMGDFILKKDGAIHSRKSSLALSDDSELDDEETKSEKRAIPRAILRRLPTFSEDPNRSSPRNSEKSLAKNNTQLPPTIVEPQQHGDDTEARPGGFASSHSRLVDLHSEASNPPKTHRSKLSGHSLRRGRRPLQFGPEIHNIRDEIRRGRIRDESIPYSMARPPVTGLAQAQPTPVSPDRRPSLSNQTRSWSISDRSVSVSIESGVPGKQEVERTRALLLSSGIKAREIARRADTVRKPPPDFLQRAFGPDTTVPSVPQIYEHEIASRRLLKRIEASHSSFEGSIERIPKAAFAPLKSQLTMLEELINKSLNTRVHAAAEEAEQLSMQLNTTSTLAVKQLSETLDHGIRKRGRRLRWLRRTGFVMLEWALIGLLWWVWLIVVAFKLLRKLLRGMMSGVRWILWL
ncbi:hypothetical protein BJX64DRAFT_252598 [Aspergillus heterothallicus]